MPANILSLLLACASLLAGCRSLDYPANDILPEHRYTVKTAHFTAEFLRPDDLPLGSDNGRFSPGGWLLSLKNRVNEELLEQKSIVPWQYAYGCPLEFTGVIPDMPEHPVRIGVGKVFRPEGDPGFYDTVEQRFPWSSRLLVKGDETEIHFYQLAGHFYFFHLAVFIREDSDTIRYELNFHNISGREIVSEFYFHPFLPHFGDRSWYRLGDGPRRTLPPEEYVPGIVDRNGRTSVSAGRDDSALLTFETVPAQWKTVIWKDKAVFAVEPYGLLKLPPSQTATFHWNIKIHCPSHFAVR